MYLLSEMFQIYGYVFQILNEQNELSKTSKYHVLNDANDI